MKRNLLLIPSLAICSLALFSCDKDDATNSQTQAKVRTYIEDSRSIPFGSLDTMDVTYDGNNRATLIADRSGDFAMNYTYTGSSSYIMTMVEAGSPTLWHKTMSNAMGLVDSTIQSETPGDSLTEKYFYNANSQVTEMREYEYTAGFSSLNMITRFQYDGNGNKIKEVEISPLGDTLQAITYSYNTAVPNWYYTGIQFMPVMQKNQPTSISYYYPSSGDTETIQVTYEMDNQNRITKEINTTIYGTYTKSYIYF